jgi:transcriptional regulator with XRE-family HTH domain
MDFATNFKRICKERGTTPTALCKQLQLSTSKANAWTTGSLPKEPMLILLAKTLNCSVMDFFADDETTSAPIRDIPNVEFALDEDEMDIIKLFRKLSRKEKHEFMSKIYWYEEQLIKE